MKNTKIQLNWRTNIKFSAFLLVLLVGMSACKKPENKLGVEVYDPEALLDANGVDTFQLFTSSVVADSVRTSQASNVLLGSYNDPVFGSVDAGFYAQFRLEANNPSFGDLNTITIDSMVLGLAYREHYGEIKASQTYEVFRLEESIFIDSTYYNFTTKQVGNTSLVAEGMSEILPTPNKLTVVGFDTLNPQLRIHLNTDFAWEVINGSTTGLLANNTTFLENFKGLYVKTNNPAWAPNEGTVLFFDLRDPHSKITIFYKQNNEPRQFHLLANSSSAYFNHVDYEYTGSKAEALLNNPENGQTEFYAQAGLIRAKIEFPSVANITKKAIIHRATLYLPVNYFSGAALFPSLSVITSGNIDGINGEISLITGGSGFNPTFKRYTIDLTKYIQDIVRENGVFMNNGIKISPAGFSSTTERIIFNGPLTTNKSKPQLFITYTEF